jgi:hypothetical protein
MRTTINLNVFPKYLVFVRLETDGWNGTLDNQHFLKENTYLNICSEEWPVIRHGVIFPVFNKTAEEGQIVAIVIRCLEKGRK